MSSKPHVVLVGSGLPTLILALKMSQDRPDLKIALVEKGPKLGGSYSTYDYGSEGGLFDHGMHIIYESCDERIDRVIRGILPMEEWNSLEGNRKDIAGIYYHGTVQEGSPYPDLRGFPREKQKLYVDSLFSHIASKPKENLNSTAKAYFESHFGETIANGIFAPIMKKLYGENLADLDVLATKLTAVNRVVCFDKDRMLELMKDPEIRSRVAYPDQLTLPPYRDNTQRGFYPRKFGMRHVIKAIEKTLTDRGVEIFLNSQIKEIRNNPESVESIRFSAGAKEYDLKVDALYWSAGPLALGHQMGLRLESPPVEKGKTAVYVNLRFDRPVHMGELYYFYCFDEPFSTFRVTNYSAYCPAAAADGTHPVCVEVWLKDPAQDPAETALRELRAFGVVRDERVIFQKSEPQPLAFPQPTRKNTARFDEMNAKIRKLGLGNLVSMGILSEPGIFFLKDLMLDGFAKARRKGHISDG